MLVCPAQFGTDADYAELVDGLRARGHPVLVTPLKFTDWLRLIPAAQLVGSGHLTARTAAPHTVARVASLEAQGASPRLEAQPRPQAAPAGRHEVCLTAPNT